MNAHRLRLLLQIALSAAVALSAPLPVFAGGIPATDEFDVGDLGNFQLPESGRAVAMAADGTFAVVWAEDQGGAASVEIMARQYSANGTPTGDAFEVNTYSTGIQRSPAMGIAADGSFVVVWEDNSFRDGTFLSVFARRVNSSGNPIGSDFAIANLTSYGQEDADVDVAADGSFVVVWSSGALGQPSYPGIAARQFNSDGTPVADEFQVEEFTTESQLDPTVALDANGNFVVAWQSGGYDPGPDGSRSGISARLFSSNGSAAGTEFVVTQTTINYQVEPALDRNASGTFVVAWQDQVSKSAAQSRVFARAFSSTGVALGDEIEVDTLFGSRELAPGVAVDDAGRFVVAWSTYDFDSYVEGMGAACFGSAGNPVGPIFTPQANVAQYARDASVASDSDGNFVLVWARPMPIFPTVVARLYDRAEGASTTTTTTTTSTTMGGGGQACGDPVVDAGGSATPAVVTASDALFILNAAVGLQSCMPCICDVTGEGAITASDSLAVLSAAVGLMVTLDCPPCS